MRGALFENVIYLHESALLLIIDDRCSRPAFIFNEACGFP
jgi:hypothetical protein